MEYIELEKEEYKALVADSEKLHILINYIKNSEFVIKNELVNIINAMEVTNE